MVNTYTFNNITENHTIRAVFEVDGGVDPTPTPTPTPTESEVVKLYVKLNGVWVPCFTQ